MKILVLKRDKLGDLLLTTPMLAQLKACRPDAELHLLANDYNAWVVKDDPHVDRLWVYPRTRTGKTIHFRGVLRQWLLERQLRAQRFDLVIAAGGDPSPRALARALRLGGRRTVAYAQGEAARGVSDPLPPPPRGRHEVERNLALLGPLGIDLPERSPHPVYRLPQDFRDQARAFLAQRGLAPGGYMVIGLGARRAKKQPTRDQVLAWAAHAHAAWGLATVFMWTPGKGDNPLYPGDDEVAEPVLAANSPHIHPFRGPLPPAIGLIFDARVSVIPDSGLMHFAAASPGGVLGLFAETDVSPHPDQWGPRGARVAVLEARASVAELADPNVYAALESIMAPPRD